MPKVSIIVPIYNTEQYIRECLNSIKQQSLTDWECLLINDGSQDRSGIICDQYVKDDSRFKVFHMENNGVSSARNTGLANASGEWIIFVDADDVFAKEALKICINHAEKNNLDALQFSFSQKKEDLGNKDEKKTIILDLTEYIASQNVLVSVWGSLFKTSIIHNNGLIFNTQLKLAEDQLFIFNYMNFAKRIQKIDDVLYWYRLNPSSATHKSKSLDMIYSLRSLSKFKEVHPIWKSYIDRTNANLLTTIILNKDTKFSFIKKLINEAKITDTQLIQLRLQSLFASTSKRSRTLAILLVSFRGLISRIFHI